MLVTLTHADAQAMTACYHAANGLFPPNQRPTATVADFEAILAQNTVLGWREQGLAGFAA